MKTRIKRVSAFLLVFAMLLGLGQINYTTAYADSIGSLNQEDRIYMVMTDRFSDGNSANNGTLNDEYRPGDMHYYQGGDWQGLDSKLDYIKDLGFTAIWISPPQDNEKFSRSGDEAGYHGYYTHDYSTTNSHFGTSSELQTLINDAHARGIKVIIDAQLNHTADYLAYPSTVYDPSTYCPAAPFNNPNWYHNNPNITDFTNENQLHNYSLGGLDDLAQENTDCWNALLSAYDNWFSYGFDGSRMDAVMEIPGTYINSYEQHTGKSTFGEAFTGSVDTNSSYQNYQWGILDYPLYFGINETFAKGNSWSNIKGVLDQDYKYKDTNKLVTFIDNHDRQRFLANAYDNYAKLRNALVFINTVRGLPVVYYGTEQGDAADHKATDDMQNSVNRLMMPSFSETSTLFNWEQQLNKIRETYKTALCYGVQREMWYSSSDSVYAFSRRNDSLGDEVVTIINNGSTSQTRTIPLRSESSWTIGTNLTNLLNTSQTVTVNSSTSQSGRQITVTIPGDSAMVLTNGYPEQYIPPTYTQTRVIVHYNPGFGNYMSVRGDTVPLNWSWGQKAENIDANTWQYVTERIPSGQTVQFKALINDSQWSLGNNYTVTGGSTIDIYPSF